MQKHFQHFINHSYSLCLYPGCKLLVLATVRVEEENLEDSVIQGTGLVELFNRKYAIPELNMGGIVSILVKMGFTL